MPAKLAALISHRKLRWGVGLLAGALVVGALAFFFGPVGEAGFRSEASPKSPSKPPAGPPGIVHLSLAQQQAIGVKVAPVTSGATTDVLSAPGRVAPDETRFAYITPRAPGIVRTVAARIGQEVRTGDLLATIDSPEVAQARLDLYTRLQELEVSTAQAAWQETIHRNTLELLDRLKNGATPEEIHREFEGRPVGSNRERLMSAYAEYRLADATMRRNQDLFDRKVISLKQYQQVRATYEAALAAYQGLMDGMGYETRLAHLRAQQARKQAETAVRVARERLRVLGVLPDGTLPEIEDGKVLGVLPDGTLPEADRPAEAPAKPESILPSNSEEAPAVKPVGAQPAAAPARKAQDTPVSTYPIWAPFDGTILDRQLIVPGVAVDTTHRIFTLADLSSVWVEANVHESDFAMLARSQGGKVQFASDAYPGRTFEGKVIYSGDLVDEKSRTVKLLAVAQNPDRLLKPGMFVEVKIYAPDPEPAAYVPTSALLTEGERTFVFVRTGPERFERRDVVAARTEGDRVAVRAGLATGEEVVVEGAFELKSKAVRMASAR